MLLIDDSIEKEWISFKTGLKLARQREVNNEGARTIGNFSWTRGITSVSA